jgi:sensor histidine kinase YesM
MHLKIAPMILQPLVENAVTHGISPKVGKSGLIVDFSIDNNRVMAKISDTGLGIDTSTDFWNKGLGLKNTRERLQLLYQSNLIIDKNKPTGTVVSFSLPLPKEFSPESSVKTASLI